MYPTAPYKARQKRNSGPSLPRSPFAGWARGRRVRLSRKDVVLTLLGVLLVYLVYTSWGPGSPLREPESARLARLMNDEASARRVWDTASSFDWSAIRFRYPPPTDPAPLPTGRGAGDGRAGKDQPPLLPRVQHQFPPETASAAAVREARRDEVRAVFQRGWRSYRRFAWMQDALLPVSGGGRDQFSGWAATLVDALDTLWIMGMREEFDEAVDAVARSKHTFPGKRSSAPLEKRHGPVSVTHTSLLGRGAGHRQTALCFISSPVPPIANPDMPQSTLGSPRTRGSTCSRPTSATSAG